MYCIYDLIREAVWMFGCIGCVYFWWFNVPGNDNHAQGNVLLQLCDFEYLMERYLLDIFFDLFSSALVLRCSQKHCCSSFKEHAVMCSLMSEVGRLAKFWKKQQLAGSMYLHMRLHYRWPTNRKVHLRLCLHYQVELPQIWIFSLTEILSFHMCT